MQRVYYVSTFLNTLNIYHSLQHFKERLTKDIRFFMYSPLHFLTLNCKRQTNDNRASTSVESDTSCVFKTYFNFIYFAALLHKLVNTRRHAHDFVSPKSLLGINTVVAYNLHGKPGGRFTFWLNGKQISGLVNFVPESRFPFPAQISSIFWKTAGKPKTGINDGFEEM